MLSNQRQLISLEKAFQQQNRCGDTGSTQLQRFFDARDCKPVRHRFQRLRDTHGAMAIGIGLDHGERFRTGAFAGQLVVVTQGLKIDKGAGWTHEKGIA